MLIFLEFSSLISGFSRGLRLAFPLGPINKWPPTRPAHYLAFTGPREVSPGLGPNPIASSWNERRAGASSSRLCSTLPWRHGRRRLIGAPNLFPKSGGGSSFRSPSAAPEFFPGLVLPPQPQTFTVSSRSGPTMGRPRGRKKSVKGSPPSIAVLDAPAPTAVADEDDAERRRFVEQQRLFSEREGRRGGHVLFDDASLF